MKSNRLCNERAPMSSIKKSDFLKGLDEDAMNKLMNIISDFEFLISDLENSCKSQSSPNESPENIIKNIQMRHDEEVESFLSQYKQKMIEAAYLEVPEQNELLNKANGFKKADDNMNYKKYSRMSIESGEEIIQRRLNNQRKMLGDQYKKMLLAHENELKETQSQIQFENRKNTKQLNNKMNDLLIKRDKALLEVRTDYLNQWAKQFPNDDRFLMFKRFMNFFESTLQEKGIPVPKTTNVDGKKGIPQLENSRTFSKSMKRNYAANPI